MKTKLYQSNIKIQGVIFRVSAQIALINKFSKIIISKELGNEARFPKVNSRAGTLNQFNE